MEHKTFHGIATKVDATKGEVEHIVAVMGNVDDGGDRIWNGAFAKSLSERGRKVRVLDQHQTDSVMRAVGIPLEIREIGQAQLPDELRQKYPEANGGLLCRTQFLMDTPEGKGVFDRIKAGAVDEYSIGYDALDTDLTHEVVNGHKLTVRNLRTIALWEYSPVLWGMNAATTTVGTKAALPYVATAKASEETAWDGPGEVAKAEGETELRRMHAWVDPAGDPAVKSSYKLPHHLASGDVVWNGVAAAAARLSQTQIPEADIAGVQRHLGGHYEQFGKTAPWSGKQMGMDGMDTPLLLGDVLVGNLYTTADTMLNDWLSDSVLNMEEHAQCRALIEQAMSTIRDRLDPSLSQRVIDDDPMEDEEGGGMNDWLMWMANRRQPNRKAGARHNADDQKSLNSIHDMAVALGANCKGIEAEPKEEPKEEPKNAEPLEDEKDTKGAGPVLPPTPDLLNLVNLHLAELSLLDE